MKKEIQEVCVNCGISANVLTCIKKFGNRPDKLAYTISTVHKGICDVCETETEVTEARDFFYPDFSLLEQLKEEWYQKDTAFLP